MAHIITRPCCNDASCVPVCPVNCIHPTPSEPDFATAEMLYIDPDACIDCGACVSECPVSAIIPDHAIRDEHELYVKLNADYFTDHQVDYGYFPAQYDESVPEVVGELTVAIVGAGPAGMFAAQELLRVEKSKVDVYDRLPTPHGLVRAGVAPDHQATKGIEETFSRIADDPRFTYVLGVEVGVDLTVDELSAHYDAVLLTVGASTDRQLGIPGARLGGVIGASEFVRWYNAHPDATDLHPDFSSDTAVIIGNGNVALDIARILATPAEDLASTDIAGHALNALRGSAITDIYVVARRGAADSAFTNQEFAALMDTPQVNVLVEPETLAVDSDAAMDSTVRNKIELLGRCAVTVDERGGRRVHVRHLATPVAIVGDRRVESISFRRTGSPDESVTTIQAGLVIPSIGYAGTAISGLPFDADTGTIPNVDGRVRGEDGDARPGVYVSGWIRRGPSGGIGMNKSDAKQVALAIIEDFRAGRNPLPRSYDRDALLALAEQRGASVVGLDGWRRIDTAELEAGRALARARMKLTTRGEMVRIATTGRR